MARGSGLLLTVLASSSAVLGASTNFTTNWNPNGDGCIDTKGFLSCYDTQASQGTTCLDNCANTNQEGTTAYQNCVNGCTSLWLTSNVGCWLQSCGNQVYSCAYQLTATSYFDGAAQRGLVLNAAVPFYPAPSGASAGACCSSFLLLHFQDLTYDNCSLQSWLRLRKLEAVSTSASTTTSSSCVSSDGNTASLYTCECCEFSWPLSNILNACPIPTSPSSASKIISPPFKKNLAPSTDKCAILNNGTSTCIKDYGFPFADTTAYNPLSLPVGEPGTEPLSNTAGNAFTVFPSPKMTLTLFPAYTSTITAAPFEKSAGADGAVVQGLSIVGGGVATTATGVQQGVQEFVAHLEY